ncbi:hypothetical protein QTG54_016942, partial [Skeletonema marinoi]
MPPLSHAIVVVECWKFLSPKPHDDSDLVTYQYGDGEIHLDFLVVAVAAAGGGVAGDGSSTTRVAGGKAVHTRKRKSSEWNDDEQAPKTKKFAKKQYQYSKLCSADGCTNLAREGKVCCRHGAKVTLCRHDGCTNQVIKGGVCCRHGGKKLCSKMDVQIKFKGEVSVVDMEERNYAVEKGAPIKLKEEVCAAVMEQRSNYAVETGVQIMLGREACA